MSRTEITSVPPEHEPAVTRFNQLDRRASEAQGLSRSRSTHRDVRDLVIGPPARIRDTVARRVARLILGRVAQDSSRRGCEAVPRAPRPCHQTPTKRTGWQLTRRTDAVERSWTIHPRPKGRSSPARPHASGEEGDELSDARMRVVHGHPGGVWSGTPE